MTVHTPTTNLHYLKGGGTMGEMFRSFDWTKTSLGAPEKWHSSLQTAVGIVLHSSLPMMLCWGDEFVQLYNDAFRDTLLNDEVHSDIFMHSFHQSRPDEWELAYPFFLQVINTGEACASTDYKMVTAKNGIKQHGYWSCNYSPVFNDTNIVAGIIITCHETAGPTGSYRELLEKKQQLEFALDAAEVGTWDLNPKTMDFEVNERMRSWMGYDPGEKISLHDSIQLISEEDRKKVEKSVYDVLKSESDGFIELVCEIGNKKTQEKRLVRAKGRTYFDQDNQPFRFSGMVQDITETEMQARKFHYRQERYRKIVEQAPMGIGIFMGPECVIEFANARILELWGRDETVIGQRLSDALPEIRDQGFPEILAHVYESGEPFVGPAMLARLMRQGKFEDVFFDFVYTAIRDDGGKITGIMVLATDVSELVRSQEAVRISEQRLRSVIAAAPAGIALFVGPDLEIQYPNKNFIGILGRGFDVEGMPLRDAMPNFMPEKKAFLGIINEVYETGKMFQSYGSPFKVHENGLVKEMYFNITFTPIFNAANKVYAILKIAIDVTEQVLAQKKLEQTESTFRGAIELAELGTWELDLDSDISYNSDRMLEWFGVDGNYSLNTELTSAIDEADRPWVLDAIRKAIAPGSTGLFEAEYTVINKKTGQKRILHAQGKSVLNESKRPIKLVGTALDITEQRQIQLTLESLVQERTEALAATNEEFAATNEELAKVVERLTNSNEELAQYAYVASHDLQEPLRKIRIYSGALANKNDLSPENLKLVTKVNKSAERMSMLIKDLLEFSKLLKADVLVREINLAESVKAVVQDFELMIEEKNARIVIDHLPVIEGVSLQINQLFYNLVGNALKFSKPGQPANIAIRCTKLDDSELPARVPTVVPGATYYHMTVSDDGVGFEPDFAEQIFEIFKRLNSNTHYQGSGIGLALCRRIVNNHGGAIYAEAVDGEGAVFHILLPDRQTTSGSFP